MGKIFDLIQKLDFLPFWLRSGQPKIQRSMPIRQGGSDGCCGTILLDLLKRFNRHVENCWNTWSAELGTLHKRNKCIWDLGSPMERKKNKNEFPGSIPILKHSQKDFRSVVFGFSLILNSTWEPV